jgi:hypothetical protein
MFGMDIQLEAELPDDYRAKILKTFPKAFTELDMGWYSLAAKIAAKSLLTFDQWSEQEKKGASFTIKPTTDKEIRAMFERLYTASRASYGELEETPNDFKIGWNEFWSSFDKLSHFTDILFASLKLVENGHTPTINFKTG